VKFSESSSSKSVKTSEFRMWFNWCYVFSVITHIWELILKYFGFCRVKTTIMMLSCELWCLSCDNSCLHYIWDAAVSLLVGGISGMWKLNFLVWNWKLLYTVHVWMLQFFWCETEYETVICSACVNTAFLKSEANQFVTWVLQFLKFERLPRARLVAKNFAKFFNIPRHIESLDACMKH
jgi:hypothetical protein